ncbi:antitoxin VbhA family protein [Rufibacter quisquiliarum]
MENSNWKPGGTFFKPAPAGLSIEELAKRAERESIANHGFALVMSNGPMPSEEAIAFMQKYVDGECSLEQALAMLLKHHGLDNFNLEQESMTLAGSVGTATFVPEEPGADEKY